MTRLIRGPFGALLATLVVLGALWPADRVQPLSTFDQPFYLGIAYDLRHAGRFTDGTMFAEPGPGGARPSGMRFAPLYPALLAVVAQLDPGLRRGIDCQVRTRGHDPACPRAAPVMRWLQFAMLAATFTLIWSIARLATGNRAVAWLALVLALPTAGVLLRSVDTLMTEITALLLTTACLAAVLAAWRRHSLPWLAAAGLLLGLAILTRPAFLYLLYATIPVGLVLAAVAGRQGARPRVGVPHAAMPEVAAVPVTGPGGAGAARPRPSLPWLAAAGLLLGLAILTRPAFLYLLYATIPVGLVLAAVAGRQGARPRVGVPHAAMPEAAVVPVTGPGGASAARPSVRLRPTRPVPATRMRPGRRALTALAVFVLCAAGVVLPWIVRNALVVGHASLTHGYDSHTLVQRISFDSMTWREYGLSYLCWLPDGASLGHALLGPHACDRFGWDERPDTFYSLGMGPLMQETLAAAGGWDDHLDYLLTHYILREPLWHAAVTVPLALRGMWIDHSWGLLLGPCCVLLTLHALRGTWRRAHSAPRRTGPPGPGTSAPAWLAQHRRPVTRSDPVTRNALWPGDGSWQPCFLLLVLPAWFMLGFNAAVAVNQTRYNLMLIPGFALAGALLLEPVLRRALGRVPSRLARQCADVIARVASRARTASWWPASWWRPVSWWRLPSRAGLPNRPDLPAWRGPLNSAAPEAPRPPDGPWRHPPLAARASGSARSNAARRRRGPRAG